MVDFSDLQREQWELETHMESAFCVCWRCRWDDMDEDLRLGAEYQALQTYLARKSEHERTA